MFKSQTATLAHSFGRDAAMNGLPRTTLADDREAVRSIRDAAYDAGHVDAYDVLDSNLVEAWGTGYDTFNWLVQQNDEDCGATDDTHTDCTCD